MNELPKVRVEVDIAALSLVELSRAIDVVGMMSERAARMARNGTNQRAMSDAFSAAYEHMVAYFHHVTIDGEQPQEALDRAAAGIAELTPAQLQFLRSAAGCEILDS